MYPQNPLERPLKIQKKWYLFDVKTKKRSMVNCLYFYKANEKRAVTPPNPPSDCKEAPLVSFETVMRYMKNYFIP